MASVPTATSGHRHSLHVTACGFVVCDLLAAGSTAETARPSVADASTLRTSSDMRAPIPARHLWATTHRSGELAVNEMPVSRRVARTIDNDDVYRLNTVRVSESGPGRSAVGRRGGAADCYGMQFGAYPSSDVSRGTFEHGHVSETSLLHHASASQTQSSDALIAPSVTFWGIADDHDAACVNQTTGGGECLVRRAERSCHGRICGCPSAIRHVLDIGAHRSHTVEEAKSCDQAIQEIDPRRAPIDEDELQVRSFGGDDESRYTGTTAQVDHRAVHVSECFHERLRVRNRIGDRTRPERADTPGETQGLGQLLVLERCQGSEIVAAGR